MIIFGPKKHLTCISNSYKSQTNFKGYVRQKSSKSHGCKMFTRLDHMKNLVYNNLLSDICLVNVLKLWIGKYHLRRDQVWKVGRDNLYVKAKLGMETMFYHIFIYASRIILLLVVKALLNLQSRFLRIFLTASSSEIHNILNDEKLQKFILAIDSSPDPETVSILHLPLREELYS